MTIWTLIVHVVIFAAYVLPIPKLVDINLTAIEAAHIDLSSRNIKAIALMCGICWPWMVVHLLLKAIFKSEKS